MDSHLNWSKTEAKSTFTASQGDSKPGPKGKNVQILKEEETSLFSSLTDVTSLLSITGEMIENPVLSYFKGIGKNASCASCELQICELKET